jgi:hypothetical protein
LPGAHRRGSAADDRCDRRLAVLPQLVRKHRDRLRAGLVVASVKVAAEQRRNAEQANRFALDVPPL